MLVFTCRQKEVLLLCQLKFRALTGCLALLHYFWGCCHILQNCNARWRIRPLSSWTAENCLQEFQARISEQGLEPPCPFGWGGNLGLYSESPVQNSFETRNTKAALVHCSTQANSFSFFLYAVASQS